jgi:hypothetical protein
MAFTQPCVERNVSGLEREVTFRPLWSLKELNQLASQSNVFRKNDLRRRADRCRAVGHIA